MNAHSGPSLGVAVIGHAFMGKAHSNAWRNVGAFYPGLPLVRQQVIVGRNATTLADVACRYGWAEHSTDWREVVTREDVDIVDVCTPGHLHSEVAEAALAAGKHVLVEKPLANSVEECSRLVSAAKGAGGSVAMVGFNYRRVPAIALARQLVADGTIGTLRQARIAYLQDWLADESAPMTWRLRKETAGSGALGDLGSHAVDLLQHLAGEPVVAVSGRLQTFVSSRTSEEGTEPVTVDDAAWATLETAGGVVASLEVSRMATGVKNGLTLQLFGTRGSLSFDLERLNELVVDTGHGGTRVLVTEADHPYLSAWWPPGHTLGWDHTFTSQAADFLRAIQAGEPASPSFREGMDVQRVLAAVEESAGRDSVRVML